jgi:outer membrane protein OmpA-like peptidoglycan-associated protein
LQTASRSIDANSAVAANLPSEGEFEEIYGRMAESALLAQTFSPPPASRGEDVGGLFAESYRGYVVKEVPVPVQFQFDSVRFTSKGDQVAAYLLSYLKSENLSRITLIGHTDPKGTPEYNAGLSLRRAQALQQYLNDNGYTGIVAVEGRGESEPFVPVDPSKFPPGSEAKNQLDRRVELIR